MTHDPLKYSREAKARAEQERLNARRFAEQTRKTGIRIFSGTPLQPQELPPAIISPRWTKADEDEQAAQLDAAFSPQPPPKPSRPPRMVTTRSLNQSKEQKK